VSNFTYRNIIILVETIKDLYKRLLDPHPAPYSGGWGCPPDPVREKTKKK
jgi:hypothetical protein